MSTNLTDQQLKVITLFREGKSDKQIAVCLGLKDVTIRGYFAEVMKRLGANSRSELMRMLMTNSLQIFKPNPGEKRQITSSYPTEVNGIIHLQTLEPALFWLRDQIIDFKPDTIVTINRGGLILGALLGKLLDVKSEKIKRVFIETVSSGYRPQTVTAHLESGVTGDRLLLVDDAYYTRQNMPAAVTAIRRVRSLQRAVIKRVVLLYQQNRPFNKNEVDLFPFFTHLTTTCFPWNIKERLHVNFDQGNIPSL